MKLLKKVTAVGLTVAMVAGMSGTTTLSVFASNVPTTAGHDKYVNSEVFNVISDDSFGTQELASPLFDKTKGSQNVTDLQVPTLAYDESSIGLVWQKPEKYDNIADYHVYINGKLAPDTVRENFKVNASWTSTYMDEFYDYYTTQGKSDVDMVNVDIHSYRATGLDADTSYTFGVVAVDAAGNELGAVQTVTQKTTAKAAEFNIENYGAKSMAVWNAEHPDAATDNDAQGFHNYNDEKNAFIEANTSAIQKAINECTPGGKVVIPEGTYTSGAVWLKSDMTLEINGVLWASPNSDHFDIGFLMYPFYTDTRDWGLVNAISSEEGQPLKNIRVTGNGKLYGNGWKYGSGSSKDGDGYTSNAGKYNTQSGDVKDSAFGLPRFMSGNNKVVFSYGVQAADSASKYLKNVTDADGNRKYTDAQVDALKSVSTGGDIAAADLTAAYATRASLLIMRNVDGVYVGDFTIENPSNHSVNILDSNHISANNVKVFSYDGNNGDGLGFGCSQNVICWNNFTDTGDDNLGFGASVGEGARDSEIQTNSEVWMFNNFLREGHGGLAAGSHTGNGIQDVLFEDTVMNHIDMAFRFKSAPTNGGFCANITMRDCAVADTTQGWVLTTSYSDANSASSTEAAEIGQFYNFASYNISVYGASYNTIQVLADMDPNGNTSKPYHTHNHLYFQDITFGNVGGNGSYKNKNGWETLIGCENSVFYNVKTVSYNSKATGKSTNKAWNNIQYCKDIIFQGTTWDSVGAQTDKMKGAMTPVTVDKGTVTATQGKVEPTTQAPTTVAPTTEAATTAPGTDPTTVAPTTEAATTAPATETIKNTWDAAAIIAAQTTPNNGLSTKVNSGETWKTGSDTNGKTPFGTSTFANAGTTKAMDADGVTQSKGTIPASGSFITYTATEDGTLHVGQKILAKKSAYIVDEDGNTVGYQAVAEGGNTFYDYVDAPVKAGKTYYIYTNGSTANIFKITFGTTGQTATEAATVAPKAAVKESADPSIVTLTWNGTVNGAEKGVFYGIETYVGGVMVDKVDGITDTTKEISRLSAGVDYTFKVYASEKSDTANFSKGTYNNRILLGEATIKTPGTDTTPIVADGATASTGTTVYTHTQGTWTNVAKLDSRVRGYKIYVNDVLKKTVYNYEIASYTSASTVSRQIGRLTPGMTNNIKIVAFTDAGLEAPMTTTATTLQNYDYKSPVFPNGAALTATTVDAGTVNLTWPAATDDTAVNGYRVYVDGEPVYAAEGDHFTPVNGQVTTKETSYTLKLDATKTHEIKVQSGDTWWKAATTMGQFDKMAGYNWTVVGLSATSAVYEKAYPTITADSDVPATVKKGDTVTYKYTITNPGTEAMDVTLTDALAKQLKAGKFVVTIDGVAAEPVDWTGSWTGNIPAGKTAVISLAATVVADFDSANAANNTISNSAVLSYLKDGETVKTEVPSKGTDTVITQPATEAPTTQAPTTQAPTTEAPTTEAPTTQAPTVVDPTTVAPTTQAPTVVDPTTVAPTTQAPTVVNPTTVAPTTAATTAQDATTVASANSSNNGGANTGDSSPVGIILAILALSALIAGAAFAFGKKKELR